jgi:endonuclease YncB( thermonuclease family)
MSATRPMPSDLRCYRASVLSTHDGDTFTGRVEVLPSLFHEGRIRLARVNAPELATPAGKAALAYAAAWLNGAPAPVNIALQWRGTKAGMPLIVQVLGLDNYGRILGEVFRTIDARNLSDDLLASGNAQPYPLKMQLAVP